jgi:2-O-(6-phospho-alpha-D-mannosyl)-D-glycerate hydrolase
MPRRYTAFVVPHTHWDRAWYLSFEEFRMRLVRLIDRVCDTLEADPDFTCFCLDGQTVVLEDYLAVRPQMRERLERLIRAKRLLVGPWYILPDELLVSPESLVRNLMLGHSMSKAFGHTMDVGYCPDTFGHVAQLPQILQGFGLDNCVFGRGIDHRAAPAKVEFRWQGPDGSTVVALHMRHWYNNAAFLGYRIGWGDTEAMVPDRKLAMDQIKAACERLEPLVHSRTVLLCNGVDHSEHQPDLPKLLDMARKKFPEYDLRIASFEDYVKRVKREHKGKRLERVDGELHYRYGDMLHGTHSSRMHLKIANQECQDLLERKAEPLGAMAWFTKTGPYPQDFLWYAWRTLLKNHPHDDICGCSADPVHADMEHRFGIVSTVGGGVVRNALRALSHGIDHTQQDGVPVMVFNPSGFRRNEAVTIPIDLNPLEEPWQRFTLHDERGREVPYDLVSSEDVTWMEVLKQVNARRHTVRVHLDLPPFGYRTLYVREGKPAEIEPQAKTGARTFENRFYRLSFAADGSVALKDKQTNQQYRNLLRFEDTADAGDVYNWSPLRKGSQTLTTAKGRARVRKLRSGAYATTWQVTHKLRVPAELTEDRTARSKETVTLEIESEVTCHAEAPRIDVVTRVHNVAKDHRLRVLFPTAIKTDSVSVDGHYGVLERAAQLPPARGGVPPYPTQPQRRFADLTDGKKGFAVINLGLPEFEVVCNGPRRTLALTLYRCTDKVSRDDLVTRSGHTGPPADAPGAQCLRPMEFRYAFMAHRGGWDRVIHEAERHNVDVCATRCDLHGGTDPRQLAFFKDDPFTCAQPTRPVPREGHLPNRASLIDLGSDKVVLSAVKKCESRNSLIVRFYNPGAKPVKGVLKTLEPIRSAHVTNLHEKRLKPARIVKGAVPYTCGPCKVMTLEIVV